MTMTRAMMLGSICVAGLIQSAPACAKAYSFSIPPQPVETALSLVGLQGEVQIIGARRYTQKRSANAVFGTMTVDQALTKLLAGTGLVARLTAPRTYAVMPINPATADTDPAETPVNPLGEAPQVAENQTTSTLPDQSADTPTADIVVTGIRASLASSVATKRNATNVVDSISAEEAGKFPDNNLAESLQRVPGVAVTRTNGLGRQISVRGLGPDFQNILLNGRSLPSESGYWSPDGGGRGRAFNFDVLPSEMISKVEINKTSLPSLTEGGIGSTINILTPRPLQSGKTFATLSAAGNLVQHRQKVTPTVTGLASWVNHSGDFGVAVSASFTHLLASEDSVRVDQWDGLPNQDLSAGNTFNVITTSGSTVSVSKQHFAAPRQMSYTSVFGSTKRYFGSGTMQYRPAPNLTLTADGFYSRLDQKLSAPTINPNFGNTILNPVLQSTEMPKIGKYPVLVGGTFPGATYLNSAAVLSAIDGYNAANPDDEISVQQPRALSLVALRYRFARSFQGGFNAAWDVTPDLAVVADTSYSKATFAKHYDPSFYIGRYAAGGVNYSLTDGIPTASLSDPVYSDPSLVRMGYSDTGEQTIDDHIYEASLNARWRGAGSFLSGINAGVNFQNHYKGLASFYSYANPYDSLTLPIDPALLRPATLGTDFLGGATPRPVPSFLAYDPFALINWLSQPAQLARCTTDCGKTFPPAPYSLVQDFGGTFATREKVYAGYIDTRWGTGRLSGNLGVRVVHVETRSNGFGQKLNGITVGASGTYNFDRSTTGPVGGSASYTTVLPSANVKFDLRDNLLVRLAASRTLSRADLYDLRYSANWDGGDGRLNLSLGNPGLKPVYSNNYDVSLEWYISKLSYVAAAAFRKDLSNWADNVTFQAPTSDYFTPGAGIPTTVYVTQIQNVNKAKINGIEVAGQLSLDDRFGWASGFGVTGNYTYIDTSGGNNNCGVSNMSPHSYNASGFYDNGTILLRGSYNWRSKWITACQWDNTGNPEWHASYGQVDLSARLNLSKSLQLYADAVNLTSSKSTQYSNALMPVQVGVAFRRVDIGARISF